MTPEFVVSFAKEAITLTIILSMPMLGLGLAVGLAVSVFQAVTSIQEMTLTFVPKILAMLVMFWVSMSAMTALLVDFFRVQVIPVVAGG